MIDFTAVAEAHQPARSLTSPVVRCTACGCARGRFTGHVRLTRLLATSTARECALGWCRVRAWMCTCATYPVRPARVSFSPARAWCRQPKRPSRRYTLPRRDAGTPTWEGWRARQLVIQARPWCRQTMPPSSSDVPARSGCRQRPLGRSVAKLSGGLRSALVRAALDGVDG